MLCVSCAVNENNSAALAANGNQEEIPDESTAPPFMVTRDDGCPAIRVGLGESEVKYLDLDGNDRVDLGDLKAVVYYIEGEKGVPPVKIIDTPPPLENGDENQHTQVITKDDADVSKLADTKLSLGKVDYIDLMILACYYGEEDIPPPPSDPPPSA